MGELNAQAPDGGQGRLWCCGQGTDQLDTVCRVRRRALEGEIDAEMTTPSAVSNRASRHRRPSHMAPPSAKLPRTSTPLARTSRRLLALRTSAVTLSTRCALHCHKMRSRWKKLPRDSVTWASAAAAATNGRPGRLDQRTVASSVDADAVFVCRIESACCSEDQRTVYAVPPTSTVVEAASGAIAMGGGGGVTTRSSWPRKSSASNVAACVPWIIT